MHITVTLPDELGAQVKRLAEQEDISMDTFFVRAARNEMQRRRRAEALRAVDALIEHTVLRGDLHEELQMMRNEDGGRS